MKTPQQCVGRLALVRRFHAKCRESRNDKAALFRLWNVADRLPDYVADICLTIATAYVSDLARRMGDRERGSACSVENPGVLEDSEVVGEGFEVE